MGLFFDDEKEVAKEKPETTNPHPGLIAGLILLFAAGLLKLLWAIVGPFLTWVFTIEGRTKEQLRTQAIAGVTVFSLLFFLVYRIPFWRDFISLSNSHTTNMYSGVKIPFPDRSYFTEQHETKFFQFQEANDIIYFTYSTYDERTANSMIKNMCQLVPRTEKILLSSEMKPSFAVGFEDMVTYSVVKSVSEMKRLDSLLIYLSHPSFLWKSKEFLSTQKFAFRTETTWGEFIRDWENVRPIRGTSDKWYELQAKSNEHALICI